MALKKQTYIDNETVITADQMNAIQDAIVDNEENISMLREDSGNLVIVNVDIDWDNMKASMTAHEIMDAMDSGKTVIYKARGYPSVFNIYMMESHEGTVIHAYCVLPDAYMTNDVMKNMGFVSIIIDSTGAVTVGPNEQIVGVPYSGVIEDIGKVLSITGTGVMEWVDPSILSGVDDGINSGGAASASDIIHVTIDQSNMTASMTSVEIKNAIDEGKLVFCPNVRGFMGIVDPTADDILARGSALFVSDKTHMDADCVEMFPIFIDSEGHVEYGETCFSGIPYPEVDDADRLLLITASDNGLHTNQWVDKIPNRRISGYVSISNGSRETVLDVLSIEQYTAGEYTGCTFVVGDLYDVHWDGMMFEDMECYMDGGYRVLGKPGRVLPFYIDDNGGDGLYVEPNAENGTTTWSTVAIYKKHVEWKLDPSYLDLQSITPNIGDNGNWFVGETDTGVSASGSSGSGSSGESSSSDSNTVYAIIDESAMTSSMSDVEIDDALNAGKTVIGVTKSGSFPLAIYRNPFGVDPVTGTLFNTISTKGIYGAKTYLIDGNTVAIKSQSQMVPSPVGSKDAGKVPTATETGDIEWKIPPGADSEIIIVHLDMSEMKADKTSSEIIQMANNEGKTILASDQAGHMYTCSIQQVNSTIQVVFTSMTMVPGTQVFGVLLCVVGSDGAITMHPISNLMVPCPIADDIGKVYTVTGVNDTECTAEWVDPATLPGANVLVDEVTGTSYKLKVRNGELVVEAV
jgi:hypothetical protein